MVLGVVIFAFAIPALIGAFSESRPPRSAVAYFVVGGGFIVWAMSRAPGQYAVNEIPQVFARVIGRFAN